MWSMKATCILGLRENQDTLEVLLWLVSRNSKLLATQQSADQWTVIITWNSVNRDRWLIVYHNFQYKVLSHFKVVSSQVTVDLFFLLPFALLQKVCYVEITSDSSERSSECTLVFVKGALSCFKISQFSSYTVNVVCSLVLDSWMLSFPLDVFCLNDIAQRKVVYY